MTPLETTLWVVASVVGLVGSAVCSGMETGLYALSRARLAIWVGVDRPPRWARRLDAQTRAPASSLAALLIGTNAFNYLGVLSVTQLLTGAGYRTSSILILNAAVVTPMLLVFAESLPKEIFRRSADRLMPRFASVLWGLRWVTTITGVLPMVMAFVQTVARLAGVPAEPTLNPRQRIEAILAESAADGSLSRSQGELIERAMQLGRARVRGEMIPIRRVRTVPLGMDRQALLALFVRSVHARYPVIDAAGRVVGVLDQAQVLLEPQSTIESLMSEPTLLEADLPVREAITQLQASGGHLAMVRDRGAIVGIVTLKDLVEPLVGELASW